jgi:hypothetical protein
LGDLLAGKTGPIVRPYKEGNTMTDNQSETTTQEETTRSTGSKIAVGAVIGLAVAGVVLWFKNRSSEDTSTEVVNDDSSV